MGGFGFPNLNIQRIKREQIEPTVENMVNVLQFRGLTLDYCMSHLLGSVGRQESSGDIDIALDRDLFYRQNLLEIRERIIAAYGSDHISHLADHDDLMMSAFPIIGGESDAQVQIDFIFGKTDWLRFSHYSPGKDLSIYKGVVSQTVLMLAAKMNKEFVLEDEQGVYADVGLMIDIRRGMFRLWRLREIKNQLPGKVDADYWETNIKMPNGEEPPRFPRIGYVDEPAAAVRAILGDGVHPDDINTFEKLWAIVVKGSEEGRLPPADEIKARAIDSLMKLAPFRDENTREEVETWEVWK